MVLWRQVATGRPPRPAESAQALPPGLGVLIPACPRYWGPGSGLEDVPQSLYDLVGGRAPSLGLGVDLLEGVDDVRVMEGHIRLAESGAVAGIEGGVPLLVLVAEAHHDHVALLDQGARADGVDLR